MSDRSSETEREGSKTPDANGIVELEAEECGEVLASERLCIVAMVDGEQPYAIPLFYGYDGISLWLGISEGKKTAILDRNDHLCLAVTQVGPGDGWRSVLVRGRARWISDPEERKRGIQVLMEHNRKFRAANTPSASAAPARRHLGGRMMVIADPVVTGRGKR